MQNRERSVVTMSYDVAEGPKISMKVLVVFWGTSGAGARYTFRILREIASGMEVENLSSSLSQSNGYISFIQQLGVSTHIVTAEGSHRDIVNLIFKLPFMAMRFLALCLQKRPNILVIPMNFAHASAISMMAVILRIRVIYVMHDAVPHPGDYAPKYQRLSQSLIVRCASRIVMPSFAVAERALADLSTKSTIRFDVSPLHAITERRVAASRTLGLGPVRFLFLGRLLHYKGLKLLGEALQQIGDRDDWRLTIAGNGTESEFVKETFRAFSQVDLSHVRWLEEHDVDRLLVETDIVICPYIEASQSGVIPEAQSYGIPAIVTPVGALPEQVDHGAAGWIARSVTSEAIAEAMSAAIDRRELYAEKSAAALGMLATRPGTSNWTQILTKSLNEKR
jgi:glycosyltransferase involved in cell wall biosynthesis